MNYTSLLSYVSEATWHLGNHMIRIPINPERATARGTYIGVLNIVAKEPEARTSVAEFKEIHMAISNGDNLPNTVASLEAKVKRRALLVAVQHDYGDMRNAVNGYLHMRASPTDVLLVYRMLLTRGYEPQNIRILVMGATSGSLSYPRKQNMMDSLEWLFHSAESGDYRYFHFSGHGYAYEVEDGEVTHDKHDCSPALGSPFKFYREALLTEWEYPSWEDMIKRQLKEPIKLDAENRIDAEELNAMINKLPEGCTLTVTLDCFHGARMYNINYKPPQGLSVRRGGMGWPIAAPGRNQPITDPFDVYPSVSPRNLCVPPAFYLYSDFSFDPSITMEWVQGPDPLTGVQAIVHVWSGYSTSLPQAGTFTSAFTSAVQQLEGDISQRDMFREIRWATALWIHRVSL
ncbi:unnamed protein product [Rhizoctonia solani]|uniref:Uncharacterized protein n=1 Tax=Rhizoctonia solani TaxID=456999 RepID=A0A8H3HQ97_9AGAM|nr:unnamed protein product [Rhizoctonia solani]